MQGRESPITPSCTLGLYPSRREVVITACSTDKAAQIWLNLNHGRMPRQVVGGLALLPNWVHLGWPAWQCGRREISVACMDLDESYIILHCLFILSRYIMKLLNLPAHRLRQDLTPIQFANRIERGSQVHTARTATSCRAAASKGIHPAYSEYQPCTIIPCSNS
jgi:hypothetical protein